MRAGPRRVQHESFLKSLKGVAMSWRKKITDSIGDILRFTGYLFIALDIIALSIFLFWFVIKFIFRFAQFINHHLFENPWF